jgi:hypothetical protein
MTKLMYLTAACAAFSIGLMAQSSAPAKPPEKLSLEQRVRALEDHEAILKTMYQYAYTIDFGRDVREYTDLYTDDAVFQSIAAPLPGSAANAGATAPREGSAKGPGAVVGREALEKWITNEWQMRERLLAAGHYRIHAMMEPDISLDGDRATVRSYFQTTDNDNGRIYMVSIGVYQDRFVRSPDGRWRMRERLLLRQGAVASNAAGANAARSPAAGQP